MSRELLFIAVMLSVALGCEPVDIEGAAREAASSENLRVSTARVIVTAEDLAMGMEVTDEMIELVEIPRSYLTPDMLAEDSRGDVVGRRVLRDVPVGALLHQRDLDGAKTADAVATKLEPVVISVAESQKRELPEKARAALLAKGYEAYLGTLTIEAGARVPQHRDPTEEFLYVIEGGGTITIDGTSHEIGPETAVFMPADAEVAFQNGDAQTVVVQVFAGPGPASKYEAWPEVAAE